MVAQHFSRHYCQSRDKYVICLFESYYLFLIKQYCHLLGCLALIASLCESSIIVAVGKSNELTFLAYDSIYNPIRHYRYLESNKLYSLPYWFAMLILWFIYLA